MSRIATERSNIVTPERTLSTMMKRGRLAHSFLLVGPDGSDKIGSALYLARLLLCKSPESADDILIPCDTCSSCRKVVASLHPDLHIIEPLDGYIRIKDIRELQRTLYLKPLEGGRRICIIDHADVMRQEAANALLKTLEEPPSDVHIFLIAPSQTSLIQTIVSRCIVLRCSPKDFEDQVYSVSDEFKCSVAMAYTVMSMAEGGHKRARLFLTDDLISWRHDFLCQMCDTAPVTVSQIFGLADFMSKDQEMFNNTLTILKSFVRDLLILKKGIDYKEMINLEDRDLIINASQFYDLDKLCLIIEKIDMAESVVSSNANLKLLAEMLLIKLREARS